VRAGEDEGGLGSVGEFADVVGEDLGGEAVEVVEEAVDEDELRFAGQGEGEFESKELAVGELGGFSEEDMGVGQAGEREEVECVAEGEVQMSGKEFFGAESQAVEIDGGREAALEDSEDAGFAGAGLACDEEDLAGGEVDAEIFAEGEFVARAGR